MTIFLNDTSTGFSTDSECFALPRFSRITKEQSETPNSTKGGKNENLFHLYKIKNEGGTWKQNSLNNLLDLLMNMNISLRRLKLKVTIARQLLLLLKIHGARALAGTNLKENLTRKILKSVSNYG